MSPDGWAGMTTLDASSDISRIDWGIEYQLFLADQIWIATHLYDVNYCFCGGVSNSPNGKAGMYAFDISSAMSRNDWGIEPIYF